ncbi:hypothetical protein IEQ34_021047 [Dendrobium chrysotoxum]|uniref:Uncharacterized protein n=1 Tax=Dendrobium chrysotoxum TaxID=161865 RepID=A0AAV7G2J2_DENCH|nr:hypothetical protein IEQ34_021047 [Dendrobium chrysotoxum]
MAFEVIDSRFLFCTLLLLSEIISYRETLAATSLTVTFLRLCGTKLFPSLLNSFCFLPPFLFRMGLMMPFLCWTFLFKIPVPLMSLCLPENLQPSSSQLEESSPYLLRDNACHLNSCSPVFQDISPRVLWFGIGGSIFLGVLEKTKPLLAHQNYSIDLKSDSL